MAPTEDQADTRCRMLLHRKQRNSTTAAAQLTQWTSLILSYCRHHRLYRLDLGETTLGHELWRNNQINSEGLPFQGNKLKHIRYDSRLIIR